MLITKAEKDALDNVRRSLESELERSRLELRQIQEHSKSLEMDNRATFEVEKLLAALTNSLDQVMSPSSSSSSSAVIVSVQSDLQITVRNLHLHSHLCVCLLFNECSNAVAVIVGQSRRCLEALASAQRLGER